MRVPGHPRGVKGALGRFTRCDRGASMVEFTIVAPFLFIVGFGIIEFGNALYGHHVITTGVRDAARYLARFDDPSTRYNDARILAVTGEPGGVTPRLSWWGTGNVNITTATVPNPIDGATGERDYRGPDPLTVVRVSSSVSYPGVGMLGVLGLGDTITISVMHEERVVHE